MYADSFASVRGPLLMTMTHSSPSKSVRIQGICLFWGRGSQLVTQNLDNADSQMATLASVKKKGHH